MPTLILPSGRVDGHLAQRGHETTGLATRGTDGSNPVPAPVWEYAFEYLPRFRRLRALTFEFQETYYERLGPRPIVTELERMHELAAR
jgi:hypothetical protein